jgi:hypothetical protein
MKFQASQRVSMSQRSAPESSEAPVESGVVSLAAFKARRA